MPPLPCTGKRPNQDRQIPAVPWWPRGFLRHTCQSQQLVSTKASPPHTSTKDAAIDTMKLTTCESFLGTLFAWKVLKGKHDAPLLDPGVVIFLQQIKVVMLVTVDTQGESSLAMSVAQKYFVCIYSWPDPVSDLMLHTEWDAQGVAVMWCHLTLLWNVVKPTMPAWRRSIIHAQIVFYSQRSAIPIMLCVEKPGTHTLIHTGERGRACVWI